MDKRKLYFSLLFTFLFFVNNLSAQVFKSNVSSISFPELNWSLNVNLKDFKVEENKLSADGQNRKVLVSNSDKAYSISVFIEKAKKDGDAKDCRKYYWDFAKKSSVEKENVKQYEQANIAFIEHDTKKYKGQQVDYHSVNAYLSYQGYWIDVQIAKLSYTPADKAYFDFIINSIQIENPKRRNQSEEFLFGTYAFYRKDYAQAISFYTPLLQMEREEILLDKKTWRIAVDNLAMSYGINKKYEQCLQVLEYGIKLDPNFPNFYYNKACAYAEQSDLDAAMQNLELAFTNKSFVLNGEKMPNPREDESFLKYLSNPVFQSFLKKYDL